jgi:hypothetical protein
VFRHSSKPQVCKRVSSSTRSWHSLSDSSHHHSASVVASNKPREFSLAVSRARRTSVSSPSWRAILRVKPSASLRAEASAAVLYISNLDTLFQASLSARVAHSFASLMRIAVLSHSTTDSWQKPPQYAPPWHEQPLLQ